MLLTLDSWGFYIRQKLQDSNWHHIRYCGSRGDSIEERWTIHRCMWWCLLKTKDGTPTFVLRGEEVRNNMDTAIIFLSLWLFPNNWWFMSFFCIGGGSGMSSIVFSPDYRQPAECVSSKASKWGHIWTQPAKQIKRACNKIWIWSVGQG